MLYLLTQVKLNQRRFKAKFKLQPVIVSSASAVPRIHSSSVKYELYICAVTPSWNDPLIYSLIPPGEAAKAPPVCSAVMQFPTATPRTCPEQPQPSRSPPARSWGPTAAARLLASSSPRLLASRCWMAGEKNCSAHLFWVLFSNNAKVTGTRWGVVFWRVLDSTSPTWSRSLMWWNV